jgi:hypothetical protein
MSVVRYGLAGLIMISTMTHTIDITTHCVCKKLRIALQEAVPLNHFKFALQLVSYHEEISPADYADIIIQAQKLARQHKEVLEKTVADTASTQNYTDSLRATAAIIGGIYLISALIATVCYKVSFNHKQAWYFYPLQKFIDEKLHKNGLALGLFFAQWAATIPAAYGICWGIHKLGHKGRTLAILRKKIANLETISAYLQELPTAQPSTP